MTCSLVLMGMGKEGYNTACLYLSNLHDHWILEILFLSQVLSI